MRVQVHPADVGGCGHYRLRWPVEVLQAAGDDVVIGDEYDAAYLTEGGPPIHLFVDADVVVLQRPLKKIIVETIPVLQRQGTAVVVEIDDDFHSLPKGHPARASSSPEKHPDRNKRWLAEACRMADLVTCTTPALAARYAPHGRSLVLPNLVPERYLQVRAPRDLAAVTIGWTGTPVTHVGDLDVLGESVATIVESGAAKFRTIGSRRTCRQLGVKGETVEWAPLLESYPVETARFDIGLVPLAANDFNEAKSALKMLEYAALGVAPIVSPTWDNMRMVRLGVGLPASDEDDWFSAMWLLANDREFRADLVAKGRDVMAALTYEQHSWRWLEAWSEALATRRGLVGAAR